MPESLNGQIKTDLPKIEVDRIRQAMNRQWTSDLVEFRDNGGGLFLRNDGVVSANLRQLTILSQRLQEPIDLLPVVGPSALEVLLQLVFVELWWTPLYHDEIQFEW